MLSLGSWQSQAELKAKAFERSLAERPGFEPGSHLSTTTRFPGARLKPLSHLSKISSKFWRSLAIFPYFRGNGGLSISKYLSEKSPRQLIL